MTARKLNRTEKIMAIVATEHYNPEEAAAARGKLVVVPEGSDAVALIRSAQRALEQANTIEEIVSVADRADAIQHYLRRIDAGTALTNDAFVVVVRAERKAGKELERMKDAGELAGRGQPPKESSHDERFLSELGIDWNQSHRWQKLALLNDEQMRETEDRARKNNKLLTRQTFYAAADLLLGKVTPPRAPRTGNTPTHPMDEPTEVTESEPPAVVHAEILSRGGGGSRPEPDNGWPERWAKVRACMLLFADDLAHGWPAAADCTTEEWAVYDAEISEVGRALLWFQRRVKEYMG